MEELIRQLFAQRASYTLQRARIRPVGQHASADRFEVGPSGPERAMALADQMGEGATPAAHQFEGMAPEDIAYAMQYGTMAADTATTRAQNDAAEGIRPPVTIPQRAIDAGLERTPRVLTPAEENYAPTVPSLKPPLYSDKDLALGEMYNRELAADPQFMRTMAAGSESVQDFAARVAKQLETARRARLGMFDPSNVSGPL